MKVAVSASGNDLDAPFVPVFGRCPTFVFVDPETLAFEAVPNQAMGAAGGAGIQAAQLVVNKGAQAVITGSMGPNAYQVLAAARVPVFTFGCATVREAVEAYRSGRLNPILAPTGPAHAGLGMRRGGMGHGGMQRGGFAAPPWSAQPAAPAPAAPAPPPATQSDRREDVAALRAELQALREHLSHLDERLDKMESGR